MLTVQPNVGSKRLMLLEVKQCFINFDMKLEVNFMIQAFCCTATISVSLHTLGCLNNIIVLGVWLIGVHKDINAFSDKMWQILHFGWLNSVDSW